MAIKKLLLLHNLIQYFFFSHFFPIPLFSPCHHPWQMMLFVLQLLLQAKSNQWEAGPAFHFEKCQVRTCLNPHIICVTVGGLSLRLVFLQWLWRGFGSWTKVWGGSEKHLRAAGNTCSWLTRAIVPPSPSLWPFPGCLWSRGGSQHHSVPQLGFTLLPHEAGLSPSSHRQGSPCWTCQKSLKTPLSHPCGYSNPFDYLKATSACPGRVGSCIPQHRHVLNTLCPLHVSRMSIPTAHGALTAWYWQENSTKIDSSRA